LRHRTENLGEVEEKLSDILQKCNLDSFVSVETIKMWMMDLEDRESMPSLSMLTGLLNEETIHNEKLVNELLKTMINLRHLLPAKALDGETFSDVLEKRKKRNEPTNVHVTKTRIPPIGWHKYYDKAMYYLHKQNFLDASKKYEEAFKNLIDSETTWREIYRLYCNAGLAYLFSGKELLGANCLEMAYELNPKYSFASEQLQKYDQGEFDPYIQLGFITEMKNNFEEYLEGPDYLHLDKVMKWSEKKILKKLSSFGVTVDKDEFIKEAKTVYLPDELAEKLLYPQAQVTGNDEDFIWIATYALWNIYCPDEPSITAFDDATKGAFTFISKTDLKNKLDEAFERTCSNYFNTLQKFIFSNKEGFLQEWQKAFTYKTTSRFYLKFFLTSLLSISEFEENVLDVAHHLNKQIHHPDWISVEIISNIRHNNSRWNKLYKEMKRDHPYHCYIACDIANYFMGRKDFINAEFYLMDALKIVDARAGNNKLSIDTTSTTIYEDYNYVFDILEEVYGESNVDSKKMKTLEAKMREVEKKSEAYSKSPEIEKIDGVLNALVEDTEIERAETSYAFQYFNYLKQFDINFETKKKVKVDIIPIKIQPEKYGAYRSRGNRKKDQREKRYGKKIGRNDPCPCGSGKKYKKCCGAIGKK
ncbi:MAG: SEC-C domain-containing protein, partial [Thermoplasmatales archaeon]|nr:SEC-C domain-containing protein [Thermoplasmatales archaeon]